MKNSTRLGSRLAHKQTHRERHTYSTLHTHTMWPFSCTTSVTGSLPSCFYTNDSPDFTVVLMSNKQHIQFKKKKKRKIHCWGLHRTGNDRSVIRTKYSSPSTSTTFTVAINATSGWNRKCEQIEEQLQSCYSLVAFVLRWKKKRARGQFRENNTGPRCGYVLHVTRKVKSFTTQRQNCYLIQPGVKQTSMVVQRQPTAMWSRLDFFLNQIYSVLRHCGPFSSLEA